MDLPLIHPASGSDPAERLRWPDWAAPLFGLGGGAIAGLGIAGNDFNPPISPAVLILGGAGLGGLIGFLAWGLSRRRQACEAPAPPVSPLTAALVAAQAGPIPEPSRWLGALGTALGLAALLGNHALAIWSGEKHLLLVVGGSVMLTCAWLHAAWPRPMSPAALPDRPAWLWGVEVACGLCGVGLAAYLWLVV